MTKATIALLLLLPAAGCGKYAAAQEPFQRHEAVSPSRQTAHQTKGSDDYVEECKWTKRWAC